MIGFNISNFHSIFESTNDSIDDNSKNNKISDETGANLDNTLGDNDLLKIFDDICPISGDVYSAMKNAASDPKNLKITMAKSGDGEDAKLFVEAVEFITFMEACNVNEGEAADRIIDSCKEEIPELDNAELHVVFPKDVIDKNTIGDMRLGRDIKNSWASRLMTGCARYGLKVNSGISTECSNK